MAAAEYRVFQKSIDRKRSMSRVMPASAVMFFANEKLTVAPLVSSAACRRTDSSECGSVAAPS